MPRGAPRAEPLDPACTTQAQHALTTWIMTPPGAMALRHSCRRHLPWSASTDRGARGLTKPPHRGLSMAHVQGRPHHCPRRWTDVLVEGCRQRRKAWAMLNGPPHQDHKASLRDHHPRVTARNAWSLSAKYCSPS